MKTKPKQKYIPFPGRLRCATNRIFQSYETIIRHSNLHSILRRRCDRNVSQKELVDVFCMKTSFQESKSEPAAPRLANGFIH